MTFSQRHHRSRHPSCRKTCIRSGSRLSFWVNSHDVNSSLCSGGAEHAKAGLSCFVSSFLTSSLARFIDGSSCSDGAATLATGKLPESCVVFGAGAVLSSLLERFAARTVVTSTASGESSLSPLKSLRRMLCLLLALADNFPSAQSTMNPGVPAYLPTVPFACPKMHFSHTRWSKSSSSRGGGGPSSGSASLPRGASDESSVPLLRLAWRERLRVGRLTEEDSSPEARHFVK